MDNIDIRDSLRVLTKLMMTQTQVVTNYVAAQSNIGVEPQPKQKMQVLLPLESKIT